MSHAGRDSVWVVYPSTGPFDAIAQHAAGLVAELHRRGTTARYVRGGARAIVRSALARRTQWLFVEYMPYSYGRWGVAPGLVAAIALARLVPGGPRLALMVHEAPVPATTWRTRLMGVWQHWQLHAAARVAELGFASTETNRDLLQAMMPRHRVVHLPIPSNVPRVACDREVARADLGLADDELAIAVFGGRHPTRALGHIEAVLAKAASCSRPCTLLNLGAEAPAFTSPARVRVIAPGFSSLETLSEYLTASDLYLAPFHDGTSTRRTTFAAALEHGLAVVGTEGVQTDRLLLGEPAACVLVPVDRVDTFVASCLRLASDATERERLGAAALALYASSLGWEATGDELTRAIGASSAVERE